MTPILEPTRKFSAAMMAGILFSGIFIFPAISIYTGNADHFAIPLFQVLLLEFALVATLMFLTLVLLKVLPAKFCVLVTSSFAALAVIIWFQSSILVWDYGVLDGRSIEWESHTTEVWTEVAAWLLLAGIFFVIARRSPMLLTRIALFVFVLQLATTGVGIVQSSPPLFTNKSAYSTGRFEEIAQFSKSTNIVHIVTDGFQSDVFEELINHPEHGETYNESFSGFVYYRETLGIFPYTRFAVPAFLSGKSYSNEAAKNEYIDNALRGETIISMARKHQFEVDISADDFYLVGRYSNLPHDYLSDINDMEGLRSPLSDSAILLDISLFRVAPGPLKKFVYNDQKWLFSNQLSYNEEPQFSYFTNTTFLNYIAENMKADREAPVYKYLHVMNTHNPMVVTEDCDFAGKPMASSRHNLTAQSKCTMDTLANLLDKMKQLNIYDSSTIVIHGDHGGWVGNYREGPDIVFPDGNIGAKWIKSLASPLLAIKPPDSSGNIATSNALASLLDLPDTLADIMGWQADFGHASLRELEEGAPRARKFRFYIWQKDAWKAEHTGPIIEFDIDGSHYEVEWKPGKVFYPAG